MSAVLPRPRRNRQSGHTETRPETDGGFAPLDWGPFAVMIHDIRTPLSVIAGTAELLQISVEQRGAQDDIVLLQRIRRNTSWLAMLVDNLATDAELGSTRRSLDWSVVDLPECLETALAIVQTFLDQRHQHADWPRDRMARVCGDRRQIEQVLINLLLNASKYGDSHSEIRVDLETCDGWTRIAIHNAGPSIPVEEQGQIFARFVRGRNAQSTGSPGLGLGLSIVRTIVERHGGKVGVVSSPEQGTRFWFTLPAAN